jgi:Ca2+-binding EF-hand superfamily protein
LDNQNWIFFVAYPRDQGLQYEGTISPLKGVSSTSNLWGLLLFLQYFDATGIQGYIDYGKIPAILIQLRKISHVEHVNGAFHFFDRNQSGYIELQELRKALADEINTNNKQVINAIMHCVNTNKVGILHFWSNISMFVYAFIFSV